MREAEDGQPEPVAAMHGIVFEIAGLDERAGERVIVAFGSPVSSTRSPLPSSVAPEPNARRTSSPRSSERFDTVDDGPRPVASDECDGRDSRMVQWLARMEKWESVECFAGSAAHAWPAHGVQESDASHTT